MKYILTIFLLLIANTLYSYPSQDINKDWSGWISRDGNQLQDNEFRKADKGFGSFLVISNDPNFFKKWNTPSVTFEFDTLKIINKGKYFIISVIFINPGTNEHGNTNIICNIKIINPDGTEYTAVKDVNVWNRIAPNKNKLGLSKDYLTVMMEPEDQLGKYKVEVIVKDRIKDATLKLIRYYEVHQ